MSEAMRTVVEIAFNVVYLITVWYLVALMHWQRDRVAPANRAIARDFFWAFLLLAAGDTGHVGFRVAAYLLGGLDANALLVGLGALATAITITFFYVFILTAWQKRYHVQRSLIAALLMAAGGIRLLIMTFPQNQWGNVVPPLTWSLYRNIPLMVQGIGVMLLIFYSAAQKRDRTFLWLGAMIGLSYAFYMPVVFLVQKYPMVGMLMIPKTLAYVAVAVIAYRSFYRGHSHRSEVRNDGAKTSTI